MPHHPKQNGISERKNRTLMNTARCLLFQAKLPDYLWAEAVNTGNYLRNRCPSSPLGETTPYESWYNEKPEVSHLREFRSKAFCLDVRADKGKLAPRSKEGRLVEYSDSSKGYRVWFPEDRNVRVVRDVKFVREDLIPTEAPR